MKDLFKVILASGSFLLATSTYAQDEPEVLDTSWNGVGEFGFVSTSGNTDTQTLNLRLEFTKETLDWRYTARSYCIEFFQGRFQGCRTLHG